jgi:hypothetical protein
MDSLYTFKCKCFCNTRDAPISVKHLYYLGAALRWIFLHVSFLEQTSSDQRVLCAFRSLFLSWVSYERSPWQVLVHQKQRLIRFSLQSPLFYCHLFPCVLVPIPAPHYGCPVYTRFDWNLMQVDCERKYKAMTRIPWQSVQYWGSFLPSGSTTNSSSSSFIYKYSRSIRVPDKFPSLIQTVLILPFNVLWNPHTANSPHNKYSVGSHKSQKSQSLSGWSSRVDTSPHVASIQQIHQEAPVRASSSRLLSELF